MKDNHPYEGVIGAILLLVAVSFAILGACTLIFGPDAVNAWLSRFI